MGQANISVRYRSEASRIDLNTAPKPLLAALFAVLGARSDVAEAYADRVIGWRTPSSAANDPEALLYQGMAYGPRAGKFPHVNELTLVRTLPPALVERALPFLTVHSGRAQINILAAEPEAIAALPGMTPERLNTLLAQRLDLRQDRATLLATLGTAQQFATVEAGNTFRNQIKIVFDNGQQAYSEVVILLFDDGREPFALLARRDDIDEWGMHTNQQLGSR
jgi:general secretion pathway protein K